VGAVYSTYEECERNLAPGYYCRRTPPWAKRKGYIQAKKPWWAGGGKKRR